MRVERLFAVAESGIGANTCYGYDALNDLTGVTQQWTSAATCSGYTRAFGYDSLGRLGSAYNPESGSTLYTYDNNSNLLTKTEARNVVGTMGYDALNRLVTKSYSGEPAGTTTPGVGYSYFGAQDFLQSVTSTASTYSYANYDALGRPGQTTQVTGGTTYTFSNLTWTPQGNLGSVTYPSGRVVATTVDGAGRPLGMTGKVNAAATAAPNLTQIGYAAHGVPVQMTTGDNLVNTFGYDERLRMKTIQAGGLLTLTNVWSASVPQSNNVHGDAWH